MKKPKNNEALENTLRWYRDLQERTNTVFLPLFFDTHRFLVLKGGGGSGKSIWAGDYVLMRATTEPGHRVLVVRKVAKTLRNSCFKQMKQQALDHYAGSIGFIPKGEASDMYIKLRNGSEIIFSGMDDPEKIKSIYNITMIWIEEASELTEADFNQLDIRLRTAFQFPLQIVMTFNPISITHWIKKRFFDRTDPRATIHESTYKDNRFLIDEARQTLESFRETDEYYYMVYCLGQWGVSGKTVFDGQALSRRLQALSRPVETGIFEFDLDADGIHISGISWVKDENGPIKIYKKPGKGRPYVIGGDTAGDGSDWFVGQVLDNVTGEQVAVLRHQMDEDTYARQIYALGQWYNDALIGVETNYSTYPVKLLDLMGYRNLYVREREDSYDGTLKHSFGFRTDKLTRPIIISELVRIMREHNSLINDETTVLEMLSFVRNEKMRPEAEAGAHDDTVMALAIAFYIRPQQSMELPAQKKKTHKWTADMWEDYRNANEEQRAFLKKMWGDPEE